MTLGNYSPIIVFVVVVGRGTGLMFEGRVTLWVVEDEVILRIPLFQDKISSGHERYTRFIRYTISSERNQKSETRQLF